jgi:hypothetical protein
MVYMAIDQYGETHHGLTHPRKDLMQIMGVQHADKVFVDKKDGTTNHIGYIVAGHWFTLYEVRPFERQA